MAKKLLIIIPFNLPWNWSTDYTNQTAYELAKRGNLVICYMWSEFFSIREYIRRKRIPILIKRISKNTYLYYPILFIPFRRFPVIVKINERINIFVLYVFIMVLSLKSKFSKKLLWIFDPRSAPLIRYFSKGWKIIYDCVDLFTSTAATAVEKRDLEKKEAYLVESAGFVAANSFILKKYLRKYNKEILLVPQGFRVETFSRKPVNLFKIKRRSRPLIGYVGAVNYRIDYRLLYKLAKRNIGWDFVIWGPFLEENLFTKVNLVYYKKLVNLPNVITGKSGKKEIPGIIKQFDVCMIPYDISLDFNKFCYPMKLFEYFYLGKPVISTGIVELKRFPGLVKLGNSLKDWEQIINNILKKPWPEAKKQTEVRLAKENSWENKIGVMLARLKYS